MENPADQAGFYFTVIRILYRAYTIGILYEDRAAWNFYKKYNITLDNDILMCYIIIVKRREQKNKEVKKWIISKQKSRIAGQLNR